MQGTWRVKVSQVGDEQADPAEMARRRVIIKDDKLIYEFGNPQHEKREGTIKLDPATHAFDLFVPLENSTVLAIYEVKQDTLKIGFGNDGLIRPRSWQLGPQDVALLELKREKPDRADEIAGWVADASTAEFPNHPAAGRLHGKDFRIDTARLSPWWESSGNVGDPPEKEDRVDGAVLTLQAGNEQPPRDSLTLFLVVKPGSTLAETEFEVSTGGIFKQKQKIMDRDGKGWFYPVAGVQAKSTVAGEKDRVDLFPKVTLRLKFGKRAKDRLPGSIYLCFDDAEKTCVAGSFAAIINENGPALPPDNTPADVKAAARTELNKLEGTWQPNWVESGGVKAAAKDIEGFGQPTVIKDGKTTWNYEGKVYDVAITVDPTNSPKTIDRQAIGGSGLLKDLVSRAIYELDGDTLRICFNAEREEQRPKKFRSDETFVIVTFARKTGG